MMIPTDQVYAQRLDNDRILFSKLLVGRMFMRSRVHDPQQHIWMKMRKTKAQPIIDENLKREIDNLEFVQETLLVKA